MNSGSQNHSLKEDFISRLSNNKKHLIALFVLFLLPVICYNAIFLGGKQFLGNDVIQWRAAAESIKKYKAESGENPLWATNMFSGMPAYTISMPADVPNIDTVIKKLSGDTYPVPFYWVLLLGAYFLFVLMKFRPLTAATGSVFISFTTYLPLLVEAGHYNKFVAFAFIPWLLAGYYMLSYNKRKWLGLFVFALATTLQLRGSHPQVTYYFLYLLLFWWLFDTSKMYKQDQLKEWAGRTGLMIAGGVLGIVCALEGYLALYEYAQYSTRAGSVLSAATGGGLNMQYAFQWSQGFAELLTLIIPGLFGGASGMAYWGPKPFTSGPHYLGAIAFLLALFGLFYYKKKIKWLFLGTGVLTMLFSLGFHFKLLNAFMFHYVPYFAKFRTPEMWLMVTVFCFAVLAVFGIHALFELAKSNADNLKPLYWPLGIALGLGLLFMVANNSMLSFEKPGQKQTIAQQLARQSNLSVNDARVQAAADRYINTKLKPERKEMAQASSIRFFILVLLASVLIVAFYKQKIGAGVLVAGLFILGAYDMLNVANKYINEESLVASRIDAEAFIQSKKTPVDQFIIEHIESDSGWPYRVFPLLSNPFNNAIPSYFYPSIGGYSGAKLAIYDDLITYILTPGGSINMAVLDMLNVKYITYNQPLPFPDTKVVFKNNNRFVIENTDVLPKAFFVDSVITVTSPQAAAQRIKAPEGFNPGETAIVQTNENITVQTDNTANVAVTTYSGPLIKLHTKTEEPGFLVLSEIYYPPGWTATIDGEPVEIYKTNFVLRGIEVPAGEHNIVFRFEPVSMYYGNLFAWIGHALLLCLGIAAMIVSFKKV